MPGLKRQPKKGGSNPRPKPKPSSKADPSASAFATSGANGASAKKRKREGEDRVRGKGGKKSKVPRFVGLPGGVGKGKGKGNERERDEGDEDGGSENDEGEEEEEEEELDEEELEFLKGDLELDTAGQDAEGGNVMTFLNGVEDEGIFKSRAALTQEYRQSKLKQPPQPPKQTKSSLPPLPPPSTASTKKKESDDKADPAEQKKKPKEPPIPKTKRELRLEKKFKNRSKSKAEGGDEKGEEEAGELVDDLESDDLALLGKDLDDDDDLSVMSDWSGHGRDNGKGKVRFEGIGSEEDGDSRNEDFSDSDFDSDSDELEDEGEEEMEVEVDGEEEEDASGADSDNLEAGDVEGDEGNGNQVDLEEVEVTDDEDVDEDENLDDDEEVDEESLAWSSQSESGEEEEAEVEIDDLERRYEERLSRKQNSANGTKEPVRREKAALLPIKLADGTIVRREADESEEVEGEEDDYDDMEDDDERPTTTTFQSDPLGARFGRPAVLDVLTSSSSQKKTKTTKEKRKEREERIQRAKAEIASLGRGIVEAGDGGSINFLRRLVSFSLPSLKMDKAPTGLLNADGHGSDDENGQGRSKKQSTGTAGKIEIDPAIRMMAMVSLLTVFLDIIPGYRIRPLSEKEKDMKVSQIVARQREWEEGLVGCYKRFLEVCEKEVKMHSKLAPVALRCMCELLKEKSNFNFGVNIMEVVVKKLGRKGWDDSSDLCIATISHVLSEDLSGSNSHHLVRLLAKTIRARKFNIHPDVLGCLLNLRLRDDLTGGFRASGERIDREGEGWKGRGKGKGKMGAPTGTKKGKEVHVAKKIRKTMKEREEVEKDMREAEATVRSEERERNQTETLKLLFGLYFRIIKLPHRSPLLPAALEGLAKFAHLVNVDFFRDLMAVLKELIQGREEPGKNDDEEENEDGVDEGDGDETARSLDGDRREKLLCIVTAFDLLSGQGEALNIDLTDFISRLYAMLLPLSISLTLEDRPSFSRRQKSATPAAAGSRKPTTTGIKTLSSEADLLFRALSSTFLRSRSRNPPIRTLAFTKRLLVCALNWPPTTALRVLDFIKKLLVREPRLEAMLSTEDRRRDGVYRGDVDRIEECNPENTIWWELALLERDHFDDKVRHEARELVHWAKE